ncbi:MAG: DUF6938 domain-containing protein [Candidatus Woesearchaeota archaeon]
MNNKKALKAWILSVDMGYGHQRAAYPLKDIAFERIITANKDKIISEDERDIWEKTRKIYEAISRIKTVPLIGPAIFWLFNAIQQRIVPFFPFKDLSRPSFAASKLRKMIEKGFGKSLVEYTSKKDIPVVTTYPVLALMHDYNNRESYSVVTDTDINRAWVSDTPKQSRITFFAPCKHVVFRLRQYGVPEDKIIETGFPLPKENIGEYDEIVKMDMLPRLVNLDPSGVFFDKYRGLLVEKFGLKKNQKLDVKNLQRFKTHTLTLTYAIGGAGAQKEIAMDMIISLKEKISSGDIKINIIVGVRLDLKMYFEDSIQNLGLAEHLDKDINIIFAFDKKTLFETTNKALRTTDILWTKPSEMSFYTALGLPIIIAPPIGDHEIFNKEWLEHMGSGFMQKDPKFSKDWIYYWLQDGRLADAAIQGFIDAPRRGTYNIEKYLSEKQRYCKLI